MTIQEKYDRDRHLIKNGDLILFSGTGLVAKIIRSSDKNKYGGWAKHSHIGVVVEKHGALFIVDANANGVQADRLSYRITKYEKESSFTILRSLRPPTELDYQMGILLRRSDEKWIKYDFKNGIKELANRRWGWNLPIYLNDNKDICSDFVSRFAVNLGMVTKGFLDKRIAFPEDYMRYKDSLNCALIC